MRLFHHFFDHIRHHVDGLNRHQAVEFIHHFGVAANEYLELALFDTLDDDTGSIRC